MIPSPHRSRPSYPRPGATLSWNTTLTLHCVMDTWISVL
ncbi:hypothetical protein GBAR_LOCUS11397 [Geodia barretti]|uniref:Uncharacterized protein n=1 Tax=Geodia barretti TaxID=519541 RepID=A0AA35WJ01_GEOBA|nr:hypothetical protein GBAR_LOCUS11397 [Geodia barretti]